MLQQPAVKAPVAVPHAENPHVAAHANHRIAAVGCQPVQKEQRKLLGLLQTALAEVKSLLL